MVIPYVKGNSFAMKFLIIAATSIIDERKLLNLLFVNNWCQK